MICTQGRIVDSHHSLSLYIYISRVGAYYAENDPANILCEIRVPTLLLHSSDDPIAAGPLAAHLGSNPHLASAVTRVGGHLAFIDLLGRSWCDRVCIDFLAAHPPLPQQDPVGGETLAEDSLGEVSPHSPRFLRRPSARGVAMGF